MAHPTTPHHPNAENSSVSADATRHLAEGEWSTKAAQSTHPVHESQGARVAVLGTGAWGTALASLTTKAGHQVQTWSHRQGDNLAKAIAGADVIVVAIAMKGVEEMAERLKAISLPRAVILVTATKGLESKSLKTPSQVWQAAFPQHSVVVLSGPNLSKEIEQGLPAATVAACEHEAAAERVQTIFASDVFRVYTNTDPLGTELGGTLKNVIAIAVGVCDGLNLGTNAKSALITRALAEVIRIGSHLGGQPETFFGLSGLGDMLATCSSSLSRNYRVGYGLAQGKTLDTILDELQGTAEGVNTANALIQLASREKIPVPISQEVYHLLSGRITPQQAVEALMERNLKPEVEDDSL